MNTADVIRSLAKFKKHLIIVGAISLVASVVFSGPFFIKPLFKSFAIVYPSNLISYSNESPTEQMLQLFQSSEIRIKVIDVFNLKAHYKIDTVNNAHQLTDVIKAYEENVSIKQTEYESVQITVLDEDPKVASRMVDSIVAYFNETTRQLQREKSQEVVVIYQNLFADKKKELDSLDALLKNYRTQYGLLDYKQQTREISRAYYGGKSSAAKELLTALATHGGEFNAMSEKMDNGLLAYSKLQFDYENALKDVSKVLTYSNMVTKPIPADKKSTPIRWLIVMVSVVSTLFVAFLVLLFMESSRKSGLTSR